MRKISLLILVFLCSAFSFGQSLKKINKELKRSVVVASAQYDSLKIIFTKQKLELESQRLAIQNESMKELDSTCIKLLHNQAKFGKMIEKLEKLDEVPTEKVKGKTLSWGTPVYSYLAKPAVPLFYESYEFNEAIPGVITDEMPFEEQNELLKESLRNYSFADSINRSGLVRIANCKNGLDLFDAKLDSVTASIHAKNQQFDEYWGILSEKYEELRAEYEKIKNDTNHYHKLVREFGHGGTNFDDISTPYVTPFYELLLSAKNKKEEVVIYDVVDVPAEFPGGMDAIKAYIKANLVLPELVTSGKVSGKCYLKFVVSGETGNVSNVRVLRGVPDCKECDDAAVALVKGMPNWIPAKIKGKSVNSYFNLPVIIDMK